MERGLLSANTAQKMALAPWCLEHLGLLMMSLHRAILRPVSRRAIWATLKQQVANVFKNTKNHENGGGRIKSLPLQD